MISPKDMEAFINRIHKNLKSKSKLAQKLNVDAYRVYDLDIPEFPFILDKYNNHLVLYDKRRDIDFQKNSDDFIDNIIINIKKTIECEELILKTRKPQRVNEKKNQYTRISKVSKFIIVHEDSKKYYVNLWDYLDTGLFLDQRKLRYIVSNEIKKNDNFLNLYSYTSSFSVVAALSGAKTTSVDLSNTYLKWSQKNFQLNKIDLNNHQFIGSDSIEFLKHYRGKKYNYIYIDPPTFSNSKKTENYFDIEKDHVNLIKYAQKLLAHSGVIIFVTNKRGFKIDSSIINSFKVTEISKETLPFDFHDQKIRKVYKIVK